MKHLIKLSILTSLLLAQSLQAAPKLENIQKAYGDKKYDISLMMSKEFIQTTPQSINANLLLGNSAFMLKHYHEALAAYERVLILDENNIYARMQTAEIYNQTNNKKLLKLELDYLKTQILSQEQTKRVNALSKNTTTQKQTKDNLFGAVSIGLLYDTNVDSSMGDKTFDVPALNTVLRGKKEESGIAHFENVYLYGNIKSQTYDNLGFKGSLNIYNKDYFDSDYANNDLTYLSLKAGPAYSVDKYAFALPLKVEKIFLDYKNYLTTLGIGLEASRYFNWGIANAGLEYKANLYSQDINDGKDSNEGRFYLGAKIIGETYQLSSTLDFDIAKERKDLRSDISYTRYGLSIDYYQKVITNLFARASFKAQKYKYKDFNNRFLNKRDDTLLRFGIGADYSLTKHSTISVGMDYLDKTSNQAIYEYDKFTLSAYYTYKF